MKSLMIATAALTLLGGAAFAQDQSSTPSAAEATSQGQPAASGAPASGDSNMNSGMNPGMGTPGGSSAGAPASDMSAGDAANSSASTPGSDASATTASAASPGNYPVCSAKVHDNCVNRSQAMASTTARHHKKQPAA